MTITNKENLIDHVKSLSELDLLEFMENLACHLQKENIEHLIDRVFELDANLIYQHGIDIETLDKKIDDLEFIIDKKDDVIEGLKGEIKELEKKIKQLENDNPS